MAKDEALTADRSSSRDLLRKLRAALSLEVVALSLIVACAFALYWATAIRLDAHKVAPYFGADTWFYVKLAQDDLIGRIAGDYHLDRVTRFHPTTVALAFVWMKVLSPLTAWINPPTLLQGLFAAVGAAGVWAAVSAFRAVVSRSYALLFGIVYALSLSVWYFASIEESKIVTATLSGFYIAVYLHLRQRRTDRGVALLTGIMLLGCLNEIVFAFLAIIPVVDTLRQRGWDWRAGRWIGWQVLAGVVAFVILEGVLNRWLLAGVKQADETSHFTMMISYMLASAHGLESIYLVLLNWLFFSVAAPTAKVTFALPAWPTYVGYFEPSLANYLLSPATAALTLFFALMLAACLLPRYRARALGDTTGIILPLIAYTALRGFFFFVFNPGEIQLFASTAPLPHLLALAIPFAASRFPEKRMLLTAFAALLFVVNAGFIFAR
jgi:hypothetical protein